MQQVREILFRGTQLEQYQRGYMNRIGEPGRKPEETYCNGYARDVLDATYKATATSWAHGFGGLIDEFDYDIRPISPGRPVIECILNTTIQTAYVNLLAAAERGEVAILFPADAQACANRGEMVLAISSAMNHEAIVCPDENSYSEKLGPLLAQAGSFNGILYASDPRTFGAYSKYPWDLKYVLFQRRSA